MAKTRDKKPSKKAAAKAKKQPAKSAAKRKPKQPVKLPGVIALCKTSSSLLWNNRVLVAGITGIYGLLYIIFAHGLIGGADVNGLKRTGGSFNAFSGLISQGTGGGTAGAYQLFLFLIVSLAIIWALRQMTAGIEIRTRDAYYQGMYPFVPFVLVLLVILVQLIPLLIGSAIYGAVGGGVAVSLFQKVIFGSVYALLALLSLFWISSSLFALYIVTLPDMTPMKALRSAKDLVKGRRWSVMRKVFGLPLVLLVVAAVIMLPVIIFASFFAKTVFFLITMLVLPVSHAYMYSLYRELLNE